MKKFAIAMGTVLAIGGAADAKTLVVYFSATGTTKNVANMIANATNGDLWELKPVTEYSQSDLDWTAPNSRVSRERAMENPRTDLTNAVVNNLSEYDTVFIGAPIWWYKASWVINDFLTQNDFGDKTIIPFCTSGSSPYGDTGREMQKLSTGGKWVDGARFSAGVSQDSINEFVNRVTTKE